MPDVLRLVQLALAGGRALPSAARLREAATRAAAGDPEALAFLREQGASEALEIVEAFAPGTASIGRRVVRQARDALDGIRETIAGNVIEGEYRDVTEGPWAPFLRRMISQASGGHVILGPTGSGKTWLAHKLAYQLRAAHGYRVECVNTYGDDLPWFGVSISMQTLINRMTRLSRYLDSQSVADDADLDGFLDEVEGRAKPAPLPPTGRVVVIDEASLAMSSSAHDKSRRAALQALAQCRHLSWHVLYIGQWAGQIPLPLFGQTIVWVKRPGGRESYVDRDNAVVRDLWERAEEGFRGLRGSPWHVEPFLDGRSWAFCDCQSLAGGRGWSGMVRFLPVPKPVQAEERVEGDDE